MRKVEGLVTFSGRGSSNLPGRIHAGFQGFLKESADGSRRMVARNARKERVLNAVFRFAMR